MPAALDPDLLLRAYATGIFPMAEQRDDPVIHWVDPRHRGVFPLDSFHISRSLSQLMRRWDYDIRTDTAFDEVVEACAARGFHSVRLIHGKGTGTLRTTVHTLLQRSTRVASFRLGDEHSGGWGATCVALKL